MWLVIVSAAIIVYVATGDALAASLFPYAWAAWPSLETAFWLRSADPSPPRRRMCFWFYLATSGCLAAHAALLSILLIAILEIFAGIPANMAALGNAALTIVTGLGLAGLLGLFGVISAYRNGLRVFVAPKLKRICSCDFSSILVATARRRLLNYAAPVLFSSIILPALALGTAITMGSSTARNANAPPSLAEMVGLAVLCFGPLAMIVPFAICYDRLIARSPSDCWPELRAK